MNRERWKRIGELYHAALKRDEAQRDSFLREACAGDEELRREVESLLEREGGAASFLGSPALEVAAQDLARDLGRSLIGKEIGSYHVLSLLGAGGMGEVYLAQDQALDRNVALKFLPQEMRQDETARKRFLREARSAAALDHPFICHIHEIGEVDETVFIAMEYVEGERLDQRLVKGPLPSRTALEKAVEMAEAVEVAHRRNIVHRDLKPSNITLTPEGHVKVMDFGLAKRISPAEGLESHEQVVTESLSKTGMTLGTLAYMSPEQLRGEEVDTRSDIFSFGIVLYEMLTGTNPFKKAEVVETGHSILNDDPAPLSHHLGEVPPLLQHTIRKMLAKEPRRRYQHIDDVRVDLEALTEGSDSDLPLPAIQPKRLAGGYVWVITVAAILTAVVLAVLHFTEPAIKERSVRFPLFMPADVTFMTLDLPVISPDGNYIAFTGRGEDGTSLLWVRSLNSLTAHPLSGTEGAQMAFWSPDSRFIGFFAGRKLKKIAASGGPAQIVCDVPLARGGSWGRGGVIVFGTRRDGLYKVSEAGGEAVPATTLAPSLGEQGHRFPHFLPDGRHFLFAVEGTPSSQGDVWLGSVDSGEKRKLLSDYSNVVYVPPGYLLFEREGRLVIQPFDAEAGNVSGEAIPLIDGMAHSVDFGIGYFSVSERGVLIYRPSSGVGQRGLRPSHPVWLERDGQEEILALEPRQYESPSISPDGTRIAVSIAQPDDSPSQIWIYDLVRKISTRLTLDSAAFPFSRQPVWTPDGRRLVFRSIGEHGINLFWKAADGTGSVEALTSSPEEHRLASFAPDGKHILFSVAGSGGLYEISLLTLDGNRSVKRLLPSRPDKFWHEHWGTISPNGKWVAYVSGESGQNEIYVRPFPNVMDGAWQVSREGGGPRPLWRPDGRELFYRRANHMMAVPVTTETTFGSGNPEVLFEAGGSFPLGYRIVDISPDGKRFLALKSADQQDEAPPSNQLIVVLNWMDELQSRASRE